MSLSTASRDPEVQDDTLIWQQEEERLLITVGSPDWYNWLDTNARFSFASAHGRFTAYKERRERGGWYWKAYSRRAGKLHRAYLGKTEQLTAKRLNEVAATLTTCTTSDRPELLTPNPETGMTAGSTIRSRHHSPCDIHGDPLLATKLSPPLSRPELVTRPRLLERLLKGLQGKLTVLSAPAGFGKTTLLGQWSLHSQYPVAWVSLDPADNDPIRFWAYLIAALQTLHPGLGDTALTLLRSSQRSRPRSFLTVLANEMAAVPDEIVLILDDYQVIKDQTIHDGLSFLLDHLPPRLHLVVATRADPPLPLARLRGRDQLTELKSTDLSFTSEETATFLNEVMRLDLAADDVAALEKRTEGWIVGLQMAALSMEGCPNVHAFVEEFAGNYRYVADYLIEEVLRRQPKRVQSFLLLTSILDGLSGPLCEAVAGLAEGEGQTLLELLERANLFTVALDNGRCWYRYHRLFAECLRTRLVQLQPKQVSELHRRASAWHAEHGLANEAVCHALAANDLQEVASLIERNGAAMMKRGELATLLGWIRTLPEEIVQTRPLLCIWHAHVLVDAGRLETAEARLAQAERCLSVSADSAYICVDTDPERPSTRSMLNHLLAVRAAIAANRRDIPLAMYLSRQALERSFGEEEYLRAGILHDLGHTYRWAGDLLAASEMLAEASVASQASGNLLVAEAALGDLANLQVVRGQLRQAAETYRQALQLVAGKGGRLFPVAGPLCLGMAFLHHEWNDLTTATHLADQGLELTRQGGLMRMLMSGHAIISRLKQAQGDISGALDVIQQAEHLARTNNLVPEIPRIAAYRVRLWLAQGNVKAAVRWAEMSGLSADDEISYVRECGHMTLARVLIAQGQSPSAVRLLDRLLKAAESAGRDGSVIKILALQAAALESAGETERALDVLRLGLTLAEPEGYVRTFVDTGAPMLNLLSGLLEDRQRDRLVGVSPSYVRSLWEAFQTGAIPPAHQSRPKEMTKPVVSPLSAREQEVLRLVALGKRPSEMAQELIVSASTVKAHIKSIYRKLEAHSSTQAVAKARELRLL
ncbi:MAG: tetratricopeptide repeat protein [Chloroflexota bacterium]|nr:MAG: tetratricopeptide repeat protein [Chloroflexota bacterium]